MRRGGGRFPLGAAERCRYPPFTIIYIDKRLWDSNKLAVVPVFADGERIAARIGPLVVIAIVISFAVPRVAVAVVEPAEVAPSRSITAHRHIVRDDAQLLLEPVDCKLDITRFAGARPIESLLEPVG